MPDKEQKTSADHISYKAYELYLQRVMHEGDLIWSRFKIYLSLNAGSVAVIAFFLKEHIKELHQAPPWLWLVILGVAIIGKYLSDTWAIVNSDGARWQLFINERLATLEQKIKEDGISLYSDIMSEYKRTKNKKEDVIDTNVRLAKFFSNLWITISVVSVIALSVSGVSAIQDLTFAANK